MICLNLRQSWKLNHTLRFLACSSFEPLVLKGQHPVFLHLLPFSLSAELWKRQHPSCCQPTLVWTLKHFSWPPLKPVRGLEEAASWPLGWVRDCLQGCSNHLLPSLGQAHLLHVSCFLGDLAQTGCVLGCDRSKWGRKAWKMVTQSKMWVLY